MRPSRAFQLTRTPLALDHRLEVTAMRHCPLGLVTLLAGALVGCGSQEPSAAAGAGGAAAGSAGADASDTGSDATDAPDETDSSPPTDADSGLEPDAPDAADHTPEGPADAPEEPPICPSGNPIAAPEDKWTWVPFPESRCGYGTSTGIGINPSSKGKKLLIFLMGGGGCFDAQSCAPSCNPQVHGHCARNLAGYDATTLATELAVFFKPGSIFDRTSPSNPLRDHSWVFVPYCTGDFHSGSTLSSYNVHHVGFSNMAAFLPRIAATFCPVESVLLAGSSAGGFGAVFNYHQVKAAFGSTRVDLVDDSGPPLAVQSMPLQTTMRAAWGAAANAPSGCGECAKGWDAFLPFVAGAWPDARLSLVSSLHDVSIGPYFGGPIATPSGFQAALNTFADQVVAPLANARVYYVNDYHHTYLGDVLAGTVSKGVPLGTFLEQQIDASATWASVRP
jgi:hypothetical protein